MKLSTETISVLKNFGAINQGIFFKKGKTLKTVSGHKNILAEVTIKEEIPADFGVYDLNNFLSVVSMHKDDPSFEFDNNHVIIVGNKGRSKVKYRFCAAHMIVTPPEKELSMPEAEISFELKAEDFDWILRAASILNCPHVAVESDGQTINLITLDTQNDSAHTDSLELGSNESGNKYRMVFKTENISKVLPGSYDVSVSSKGISQFKNKTIPLQYYISTEQGSKFERKQ